MKFKIIVLLFIIQTVVCKERKTQQNRDQLSVLRFNGSGSRPAPRNYFDEVFGFYLNVFFL